MYYKPLVYLMYGLLPWMVWFFGAANYYSDYINSTYFSSDNEQNMAYDFIVVGSGAAGAVVAHRLSTSKDIKVLLIEAGGDPSFLNNVPAIAADLIGYPETDWMHMTVPQKHACWAMKNNQSMWNAGKVLGGSTQLNMMFYLRGHPADYDNWANLTGDGRWSYENVLPFFKKSIKSYNGEFSDNKKHYSESDYGFLNIEDRNWLNLYEEFKESGEQNGFPTIDANGGSQRTGFAKIEATQKNGQRFGTYSAIILQLENKPNVKILRYSRATKVKLDQNLRAEGVWYMQHGVKKFARAKKEVILSAGSVNSPQILMMSGVGPKSHLQSVGIKTRLNLPVGENLHDHIMTMLTPFLINQPKSFLANRDFSPAIIYDFSVNGKGPLTVPNALHSQLFYSSASVRKSGVDWPDVQGFFAPAGTQDLLVKSICRGQNIREELFYPLSKPHIGRDSFVILAGLVRPKSRGNVRLQDKNPLSRPLIDPHYLEHPDDVTALVDGVKKIVDVFESSEPFKKLDTHLPKQHTQGCEQYEIRSDAYWACYIRHYTLTIWHPVGTCRMGRVDDKKSVVDTRLRVLGAKGLRVIDASIMPVIVNANTAAPSMMIGEVGSDAVREFWSQQFRVSNLWDYTFSLMLQDTKCYYSQLV